MSLVLWQQTESHTSAEEEEEEEEEEIYMYIAF